MNVCENTVGLDHRYEREDIPLCINCGQCIMNCPVGSLATKFDYKRVLNILKDTNRLVAVSLSPAVRVALGTEFGYKDGENFESIIPTILRKIGFSFVFDITFGADTTIMEEANELLLRLEKNHSLPMFTSCCPSWVKYAEMFHPELLPNISSTKSPIAIESTLIKTYYREMNGIEDEILSVVVAPCTAKKAEIIGKDTDYIITTQELAMMMRECDIDFDMVKPSDFDKMLGKGSKGGLIFGRSGGVMSSALSYLYYLVEHKNPPLDFFNLDIRGPITESSYKIGGKILRIAVIYGMKHLEEFLPKAFEFDFIEVMNCPGGCIGGGGQPLVPIGLLEKRREERTNGLNGDKNDILYCYQNPEIVDLYSSYLGSPLSNKAIHLLHTAHEDKSYLIEKI